MPSRAQTTAMSWNGMPRRLRAPYTTAVPTMKPMPQATKPSSYCVHLTISPHTTPPTRAATSPAPAALNTVPDPSARVSVIAMRPRSPSAASLLGSGDGCGQHRDDALLILGLDLGEEGESHGSARDRLCHRAEPFGKPVALSHVGLEMDARDVLGASDPIALECVHDLGTVERSVQLHHVYEPRALVVGVAGGWRRYAVDPIEQLPVTSCSCRAVLEDLVELLQLCDPDRRLNVRPAIVHAEPYVMEPSSTILVRPTLVSQAA